MGVLLHPIWPPLEAPATSTSTLLQILKAYKSVIADEWSSCHIINVNNWNTRYESTNEFCGGMSDLILAKIVTFVVYVYVYVFPILVIYLIKVDFNHLSLIFLVILIIFHRQCWFDTAHVNITLVFFGIETEFRGSK